MKRLTPLQAILIGGAVGGLGDIVFAIGMAIARGDTAVHLLQIVASGALGQAAFEGGMRTAALGLALHFLLSFGWAALFVLAARAMPALLRRPLLLDLLSHMFLFALPIVLAARRTRAA